MVSEGDWKGLHPASVAVNLLPRGWRVVRQFWPLLLAIVWGGASDRLGFFELAMVMFFFSLTVGNTVVHWLTLRYRVHEGRLELVTGLMQRQVRTIDPARVQNIEMTRNVFHRMSGLVEVRLETASGDEAEGLLSALSEADARALIAGLEAARARAGAPAEPDEDAPELVSLGIGDLLRYGATATPIGMVLVFVGVGFEALQVLQLDNVESVLARAGAVALAPLLLGGAWLAGLAIAVGRHYGFRLRVGDRSLVAEEGLFTRRRIELRPEKVQLVTVTEPLVRRWLGFGSVQVETAAAAAEAGGTRTAEAVVPVVDTDRIAEVVRGILPLDVDLASVVLRPPHPRALVRAIVGSIVRGVIFGSLGTAIFWPWGLLAWLALPVGAGLAWFDFRNQGWLVTERAVVVRRGWWRRSTQVMPLAKIQATSLTQGPLLRRHGLGVLTLRAAGSAAVLPVIAWEEARELLDSLVPSAAIPPAPAPAPASEAAPSLPLLPQEP